jgi:hypothetical protein
LRQRCDHNEHCDRQSLMDWGAAHVLIVRS